MSEEKRAVSAEYLTWSPKLKRKKIDLVYINIVETNAANALSDEDHHIINHDAIQTTEALLMLQNSESEQAS